MVEFRVATNKDVDLLTKLSQEIWNLHYINILSKEQIDYMLEKMYTSDIINEEINKGIIWKIVYYNNEPIGYFSYSMINEKQCKLHKIYILPTFHGKGFGKSCITDVFEYTKNKNANEVILYVNRFNEKAIKSYSKYGFKILKEEDTKFGDFVLNDYVMKKELN